MAQLGGRRPGAGRPKGRVTEAKRQLAAMAKEFAPEALQTIVDLMRAGENEQTRLAAARELLDRGFGKPFQAVGGDDDEPGIKVTLDATEAARRIAFVLSQAMEADDGAAGSGA